MPDAPGRVLARSAFQSRWIAFATGVAALCWGLAWSPHARGAPELWVLVVAPIMLVLLALPLWRFWAGSIRLDGDMLYWPRGQAFRGDIVAVRCAYTTWGRIVRAAGVWFTWAVPLKPNEVDPDRHVPLVLWMDTGTQEFRVGLLRYPTPQVLEAIEVLRAEGWPLTLELKGSSDA